MAIRVQLPRRLKANVPAALDPGEAVFSSDTGEILVGTGTGRVVIGAGAGISDGDKGDITVSSSGTVWTINTGAVAAAELAGTRVAAYLSTNQPLTQNVWNTVQLDTETEDSGGEFDPLAYTFTPAATGLYLVDFRCTVGGASGRQIAALWLGTTSEVKRLSDGTDTLCGSLALVSLTASQGYTLRVFPTASGTEALAGADQTSVIIRRHY